MEVHEPPCRPLQDVDKKVDKMAEDIACFRGKFDVMFAYMVPKNLRKEVERNNNENNPGSNPGPDVSKIEQARTYRSIIKTLLYVIGGLAAVIIGFQIAGL